MYVDSNRHRVTTMGFLAVNARDRRPRRTFHCLGIARPCTPGRRTRVCAYRGMTDRVVPLASNWARTSPLSWMSVRRRNFEGIRAPENPLGWVRHSGARRGVRHARGAHRPTSSMPPPRGVRVAHDISSYSLTALARRLPAFMQGRAGSIVTLSYLGAIRSIPNYNVMGLARRASRPTCASSPPIWVRRAFA